MEEENNNNNNDGTITIKKDAMWKYATFALLAIVVIGAIAFIIPNDSGTTGNAVVNPGTGNNAAPTRYNVEVTEEDNFIQGSPTSKVIIIESSDFECPFCERAHSGAVSQIRNAYSDQEVAIVYNQFPLSSIHPNAQKAAEASECAGDQGKFVEMHDMLFESGVSGGLESFKSYAVQLGLNTAEFDSCLDSGEKASDVKADLDRGQSAGARGTPHFLVNGITVSGAQPFEAFSQIIDAELAK